MNEHMVRSALGSTSGGAGSPNGLTEGVSSVFCSVPIFRSAPPQLRIRSAAFNSGMIATGNHNFERFAALCNTPKGAPRALRAMVCAIHPGTSENPMFPAALPPIQDIKKEN